LPVCYQLKSIQQSQHSCISSTYACCVPTMCQLLSMLCGYSNKIVRQKSSVFLDLIF
jgi:hypothetical protein